MVSPRCDGGTHCLQTRRQQGARIRYVPSESAPIKRVTIWLWWLDAAGRCRLLLVAAGRLHLHAWR
jgi:hypothetical protein